MSFQKIRQNLTYCCYTLLLLACVNKSFSQTQSLQLPIVQKNSSTLNYNDSQNVYGITLNAENSLCLSKNSNYYDCPGELFIGMGGAQQRKDINAFGLVNENFGYFEKCENGTYAKRVTINLPGAKEALLVNGELQVRNGSGGILWKSSVRPNSETPEQSLDICLGNKLNKYYKLSTNSNEISKFADSSLISTPDKNICIKDSKGQKCLAELFAGRADSDVFGLIDQSFGYFKKCSNGAFVKRSTVSLPNAVDSVYFDGNLRVVDDKNNVVWQAGGTDSLTWPNAFTYNDICPPDNITGSDIIPMPRCENGDEQYCVKLEGSAIKGAGVNVFIDTGSMTLSVPEACVDTSKIRYIKKNTKTDWGREADLVEGQISLKSVDGTVYTIDKFKFFVTTSGNLKTRCPSGEVNTDIIFGAFPRYQFLDGECMSSFFMMLDYDKYNKIPGYGLIPGFAPDGTPFAGDAVAWFQVGLNSTIAKNSVWYQYPRIGYDAELKCPRPNFYAPDTMPSSVALTNEKGKYSLASNQKATIDNGAPVMTLRDDEKDSFRNSNPSAFVACPSYLFYMEANCRCLKEGYEMEMSFNFDPTKKLSYKYKTGQGRYLTILCGKEAKGPFVGDAVRYNTGNTFYNYFSTYYDIDNGNIALANITACYKKSGIIKRNMDDSVVSSTDLKSKCSNWEDLQGGSSLRSGSVEPEVNYDFIAVEPAYSQRNCGDKNSFAASLKKANGKYLRHISWQLQEVNNLIDTPSDKNVRSDGTFCLKQLPNSKFKVQGYLPEDDAKTKIVNFLAEDRKYLNQNKFHAGTFYINVPDFKAVAPLYEARDCGGNNRMAVSLKKLNGNYVRHQGWVLKEIANPVDELDRSDSTFCLEQLDNGTYNIQGYLKTEQGSKNTNYLAADQISVSETKASAGNFNVSIDLLPDFIAVNPSYQTRNCGNNNLIAASLKKLNGTYVRHENWVLKEARSLNDELQKSDGTFCLEALSNGRYTIQGYIKTDDGKTKSTNYLATDKNNLNQSKTSAGQFSVHFNFNLKSSLSSGEYIWLGNSMCSQNKKYKLKFQLTDGQVVLSKAGPNNQEISIWKNNKVNYGQAPGDVLIMFYTGSLGIAKNLKPIWKANDVTLSDSSSYHTDLQDDGNLVTYSKEGNSSNNTLWDTKTDVGRNPASQTDYYFTNCY